MLKIEFVINEIFEGEFTLGMYSQRGEDENGEFYSIIIGIFFFEIGFYKYKI